ncbi:MAG: BlaI/MecI/CopY family transcriptional regulator [Gammaproteobacteria bacterium]|nr:BlaI/MecI/CopY family transcriptional regulator [Gammaproteobacteria bacterium]
MTNKETKKESILSRRERQVMDIVYANGRVSVADVQAVLPDKPSYSATRMLMRRLEKKNLVKFAMEGPRYVYSASTPRGAAGKAALTRLVRTFFDGSAAAAFSSLLGTSSEKLSDDELDELQKLVAQAKERRK